MTAEREVRYGRGMLPLYPQAQCSVCGQWSYFAAAIGGVCLSCAWVDEDEAS